MFSKCIILTFIKKIYRSVKRTFTRRPAPIVVDEYEYNENKTPFNCEICYLDVNPGSGIILKSCGHGICKACVIRVIKYSTLAEIPCPFNGCPGIITDREIRCFISYRNYKKLLNRSLAQAEILNKHAFHCKTPNCIGWVEVKSRRIERFICQVCKKINCIPCKAVHERSTCRQYREQASVANQLSNRLINTLLKTKIVKRCPKCTILIQKDDGCDHMSCTKCKVNFQWSGDERGPRYRFRVHEVE